MKTDDKNSTSENYSEKNKKFLKFLKEMTDSLPPDEDCDEQMIPMDEFNMYSKIARASVPSPKTNKIENVEKKKNDKAASHDCALYDKVVRIARSIKEFANSELQCKNEVEEGLFMLLESTLRGIEAEYSEIARKLHDINEKYFSKKPSVGRRFDVIDQNGDLLLGVVCERKLLDEFGMAVVREIDENGFIVSENPNASRKLLNGNYVTDNIDVFRTNRTESPFSETTTEEKEKASEFWSTPEQKETPTLKGQSNSAKPEKNANKTKKTRKIRKGKTAKA